MNLPNKHQFIEQIAQEAHHKYLDHFHKYGKRESYSPDRWVQENYPDFSDYDCMEKLFKDVEDRIYKKWGFNYDERFIILIEWVIKRYLNEIENRMIDYLT